MPLLLTVTSMEPLITSSASGAAQLTPCVAPSAVSTKILPEGMT